ncbi:hypothetical protein F4V57_12475 [Acinetobacter qingfengensis]|uniref:Uncharacterized protein n=1 Tax=Acinetobacter qingfengensis TaxID=1262585 RepID=A0A1E7QYV8_9GAMM|nr:hypothetical protein [Acinetobacter qingfengensis]KAA8731399.1 hypothetical protein F4V57_12475 [Acinetobacter qingfengensis]OEY92196.1 hypothetical protein BJI46_05435 [Acinetobacter qingfengensis]
MLLKFAIRFLIILFAVIALTAIAIHFFFSSQATTLWIMMMPVILGIPILAAIIFTTDNELNTL